MKEYRLNLHIPVDTLVLWDSRCFHSNRYCAPDSKEIIVRYVCFLPKNHLSSTITMQKKRTRETKNDDN